MRRQENWLVHWAGECAGLFVLVLILLFFTSKQPAKSWPAFWAALTGRRLLAAAVGAFVAATVATLVQWLVSRAKQQQP